MNRISKFFDDYLNLPKIMDEKREYKAMMARVNALPEDYRYVYEQIQEYMWSFASGSGMDMLALQENLLEMFEENAAAGRPVLEVTGDDVGTFANELLEGVRTWPQDMERRLNEKMRRKLGNASSEKT